MAKVAPEDKIIEERIKKLDAYIDEKKIFHFYHFLDDNIHLSTKNIYTRDLLKRMKEHPTKYVDKRVAQVFICTYLENLHKPGNLSEILTIKIVLWKVQPDGNIESARKGACLTYNTEDFKKIKFSLKYVKSLMNLIKDNKLKTNLLGQNYSSVIKKLEKEGVDTKPLLK